MIKCIPLLLTHNRFLAFKGSEVSSGRQAVKLVLISINFRYLMSVCMLEPFKRASMNFYNHRVLTPADKKGQKTHLSLPCALSLCSIRKSSPIIDPKTFRQLTFKVEHYLTSLTKQGQSRKSEALVWMPLKQLLRIILTFQPKKTEAKQSKVIREGSYTL